MKNLPTPLPMQAGPAVSFEMPQVLQQMKQQQAAQTDPPQGTPEGEPEGGSGGSEDPKGTSDPKEGEKDGQPDVQALTADRDKWKALSRKNEESFKKEQKDAQAWRDHLESQKTDVERKADEDNRLQEQIDATKRENAMLKLGVKHSLSEENLNEIQEILEDVPADKFFERAEKLAKRFVAEQPKSGPTPDKTLGRETPPASNKTGDFLRDAMTRR